MKKFASTLLIILTLLALSVPAFANEPKAILGENMHAVWDLLRSYGYSEVATAAIMGNLHRESRGLWPFSMEGYTVEQAREMDERMAATRQTFCNWPGVLGYGLAGWTGTSAMEKLWDFCEDNGYKANTIEGQIAFLDWAYREEQPNSVARMEVYEPEDIVTATEDFRQSFEKSAIGGTQYMRALYAKAIYKECSEHPETFDAIDEAPYILDIYVQVINLNKELGLEGY